MAEAVEEHRARALRLVVVQLVHQVDPRMRRLRAHELVQVGPQLLQLRRREHWLGGGDVAILCESLHLGLSEGQSRQSSALGSRREEPGVRRTG